MGVPPGMGAAEYLAYCYARADPVQLRATREWTFEHFKNYPNTIYGPKREYRAPSTNATSGRPDTVVGLPSPSASEHGQPVDPQIPPTAGPSRDGSLEPPGARSVSAGQDSYCSSRCSRGLLEPRSGTGSRISKDQRRKRKISTRHTHSKASPATPVVHLNSNDETAVTASPVASPTNEPVIESLTENALSKLSGDHKRKRDDEDEPPQKRARAQPSPDVSNAASGPEEATTTGYRDNHVGVTHIGKWLYEQQSEYEPLDSPSIRTDSEVPRPINPQVSSKQGTLRNMLASAPHVSSQISSKPVRQEPTQSVPAANAAPAELDEDYFKNTPYEDVIKQLFGVPHKQRSNHTTKKLAAATKSYGATLRQSIAMSVFRKKVETLIDAYCTINAYCRGLGLRIDVADAAKLYLHDIFYHEFFEDLPVHSLIAACVIRACNRHNIYVSYPKVFSPDLPKHTHGRARTAVDKYYETKDTTKLKKHDIDPGSRKS